MHESWERTIVRASEVRPGNIVSNMLVQAVEQDGDLITIHLYGVASKRREVRDLPAGALISVERVVPHSDPFRGIS